MSVVVETQPVCLLRLSGGLGNQLFQYAAGRSLALRTGAKLVLDISFYDKGRHRSFELTSFPIQAEVRNASSGNSTILRRMNLFRSVFSRERVYREPHFHFDPSFESLRPPVTLEGYFQTFRYFAEIEHQIRQELKVPVPVDRETLRIDQQMADSDSTVLHIRRGDYVSSSKVSRIYSECSMDYYRNAMESISGSAPVLVLSDDLHWAKTHLPKVKPLLFPSVADVRSGLADLWLMTRARNHIIANSSFSWWGAWLAKPGVGKKIAPKRWFNDSSVNDGDLIPADWIRL